MYQSNGTGYLLKRNSIMAFKYAQARVSDFFALSSILILKLSFWITFVNLILENSYQIISTVKSKL